MRVALMLSAIAAAAVCCAGPPTAPEPPRWFAGSASDGGGVRGDAGPRPLDRQWQLLHRFPYVYPEQWTLFAASPSEFSLQVTHW